MPPPFIPIPSEPYSTAPSIVPTPRPMPAIVPVPAQAQPYPASAAMAPLPKGFFRLPTWLERPDGDLLGLWMDDGQRGLAPKAPAGLYGVRLSGATWQQAMPFLVAPEPGNGLQTLWNPVSATFWLAWSVYRGNYKSDVLVAQVTPDGALKGDVQTISRAGSLPQMAVDTTTGTVAVAWSDERLNQSFGDHTDVYARRFAADGTALGDDVPVCTDPGSQTVARVLAAPAGGFGVVWYGGNPAGLHAQRLDASGRLQGERITFALGDIADGRSVVSTTHPLSGEHYIAWPSTRRFGSAGGMAIQGQRLTADLQPIGEAVAVAAGEDVTTPRGAITDPATGMIMIVWHKARMVTDSQFGDVYPSGGDLTIQRVGADGRPIGTPVTLVRDEADGRMNYEAPVGLLWLKKGWALASWAQTSDSLIRLQPFVVPR